MSSSSRRIIETGDGFDQALDDVALVVNGKLNGDAWPLVTGGGAGGIFLEYL